MVIVSEESELSNDPSSISQLANIHINYVQFIIITCLYDWHVICIQVIYVMSYHDTYSYREYEEP